jgi:hypothetical protein
MLGKDFGVCTPSQHRPVVVRQGKGCGDMDIPPPGMVRNPGPHFDQIGN